MKSLLSLIVASVITFWLMAFPQAGKAQGKTPVLTTLDRNFAVESAMGNMTEVQLGELAQSNGGSDFVRQFGAMMVKDHGAGLDELKGLAAKKNIRLPMTLSASAQASYNYLSRLNGSAFDQAYRSKMLKDHQAKLTKFRNYSAKGRDAELRAFASKGIGAILKHLRALRTGRIAAALPGTGRSYDLNNTLVTRAVQGSNGPSRDRRAA